MSLSFHIMFAALGVVMAFFLLLSQGLYLRRKNPVYLALNKKWTTAFAITYAIGAVSGVVLTFGLGLFWPRSMALAGPPRAGPPACASPARPGRAPAWGPAFGEGPSGPALRHCPGP